MDQPSGHAPPAGTLSGGATDDWPAEFRRQSEAVWAAAEEWAIRWSAPEGQFISAMLGLMATQSRILLSAQASLEGVVGQGRELAGQELAQARKLRESVEALGRQTQTVHLQSIVEKEAMVQRLVKETLPLFAKSLSGAMVIRERAWNRGRQLGAFVLAGLMCLAVFAAGYALSAWSTYEQVAAMERCLLNPVPSNGHVFCQLDAVPASGR